MEKIVQEHTNKITTHDEQMKSVFKRLSTLETQNKEAMEKIQENQREILKLKTEFQGFNVLIAEQNKTQTLEIQKLFENALAKNSQQDNDREKLALQGQVDKNSKYMFWIVTTVLGSFILYILSAFVYSR